MNAATDKKTFWIGILSLTATLLLMGNYFAPQPVLATTSVKDRDFSMVTANTQTGGESLYVLDNRSGRIAVYSYDPSSHQLRTRGAGAMTNLFAR
jgi:hypothetical protein